MPFGMVLSFKELMQSVGSFPFLPSSVLEDTEPILRGQQKRENQSTSAISASLAKPPRESAGVSGGVEEMSNPIFKTRHAFAKQYTTLRKSLTRRPWASYNKKHNFV